MLMGEVCASNTESVNPSQSYLPGVPNEVFVDYIVPLVQPTPRYFVTLLCIRKFNLKPYLLVNKAWVEKFSPLLKQELVTCINYYHVFKGQALYPITLRAFIGPFLRACKVPKDETYAFEKVMDSSPLKGPNLKSLLVQLYDFYRGEDLDKKLFLDLIDNHNVYYVEYSKRLLDKQTCHETWLDCYQAALKQGKEQHADLQSITLRYLRDLLNRLKTEVNPTFRLQIENVKERFYAIKDEYTIQDEVTIENSVPLNRPTATLQELPLCNGTDFELKDYKDSRLYQNWSLLLTEERFNHWLFLLDKSLNEAKKNKHSDILTCYWDDLVTAFERQAKSSWFNQVRQSFYQRKSKYEISDRNFFESWALMQHRIDCNGILFDLLDIGQYDKAFTAIESFSPGNQYAFLKACFHNYHDVAFCFLYDLIFKSQFKKPFFEFLGFIKKIFHPIDPSLPDLYLHLTFIQKTNPHYKEILRKKLLDITQEELYFVIISYLIALKCNNDLEDVKSFGVAIIQKEILENTPHELKKACIEDLMAKNVETKTILKIQRYLGVNVIKESFKANLLNKMRKMHKVIRRRYSFIGIGLVVGGVLFLWLNLIRIVKLSISHTH
jgi:hypothetical protein